MSDFIDEILRYKPNKPITLMDLSGLETIRVIYTSIKDGDMLKDYGYGLGLYGFKEKNTYLRTERREQHTKLYKVSIKCDIEDEIDFCHLNERFTLEKVLGLDIKDKNDIKKFIEADRKYKLYNVNIKIPNREIKGLYDYMGEAVFIKDISLIKEIKALK